MNINNLIYRESRIRFIWPLLAVGLLVILGEILVVDSIGTLLLRLGLTESTHTVEHDWSPALYDIIKRSIRSLMVLLAVWIPVRFMMGHRLAFTGYRFDQRWKLQLGLGVALGFLVQIIPLLLMSALGWFTMAGWLWDFQPLAVLIPALLFSFVYSLETGVIEESLFRGFFMQALIERHGVPIALVASSVLFGLLHFSGFGSEFPWWLSLISATFGGFVFGQAFLLYGAIWVPLAIHFAIHFSARILGTVGIPAEEATLLVTKVDGPVLLVVTRAGGASLLELLGYGVVSVVLYLLRGKRIAAS